MSLGLARGRPTNPARDANRRNGWKSQPFRRLVSDAYVSTDSSAGVAACSPSWPPSGAPGEDPATGSAVSVAGGDGGASSSVGGAASSATLDSAAGDSSAGGAVLPAACLRPARTLRRPDGLSASAPTSRGSSLAAVS